MSVTDGQGGVKPSELAVVKADLNEVKEKVEFCLKSIEELKGGKDGKANGKKGGESG